MLVMTLTLFILQESNNAIIFGYMTAWFLGEVFVHHSLFRSLKQFIFQNGDQPVLAHFHEWLAGIGLILARVRQLKVVFPS